MLPGVFSKAVLAIRGLELDGGVQAIRAGRAILSYGLQQIAGPAQPSRGESPARASICVGTTNVRRTQLSKLQTDLASANC